MDTTTKLIKIKKGLEEAKASYERAQGRLEVIDKEIRDLGCDDVDALKKMIDEQSAYCKALKEAFDSELAAFEQAYGHLL